MKQICEVAIIGAGPYGLSLAAHLRARGIDYRIFGKPMDTWKAHMPKNMTLKSEGFASNLSAPQKGSRIKDYCLERGIAYSDRSIPIAIDTYLDYTKSFRDRFTPDVEETMVTALSRNADHFELSLYSGERVMARNVVLAVGVTWFAWTPEVLRSLPPSMLSHSYAYRDVEKFRGKEVAVVGSGSSAIDLAHLLQETGASVRIVARRKELQFNSVPDGDPGMFHWLQNPPSTIGRGWGSYFCAEAPLMFYRLPRNMKDRAISSHMHPAAGWFMREQVEGRIPLMTGRTPIKAEAKDGRAVLTLTGEAGEETLSVDHVIAATGYEPDLDKLPFLAPSLNEKILRSKRSPLVSDRFETSVPGLYATGLAAMDMFGPLLRFMVGAEFAAPRLAAHLDRVRQRVTARAA
ncbi:MAG TPA: NAD(P)-binding domain-containing protein [Rhizomicrobium sp.]|nr:NAD(P)-binding domain-containing protein [Rhizomicrobium sp.]